MFRTVEDAKKEIYKSFDKDLKFLLKYPFDFIRDIARDNIGTSDTKNLMWLKEDPENIECLEYVFSSYDVPYDGEILSAYDFSGLLKNAQIEKNERFLLKAIKEIRKEQKTSEQEEELKK